MGGCESGHTVFVMGDQGEAPGNGSLRHPRRFSQERRHVGGRRSDDYAPRADITKTVVAVIVALVNLFYLVVTQLVTDCTNWFIF